ncbi:MAG: hypothetical protein CL760_00910 [Chloroflexi bacterium]|nr:hypothetical protein [Chloroflexota bacterium]|tara:strand:+ start:35969 stop:36718 length:750 start_codon:yes stop_codon:yes gene_type:complete
MLNPNKSKKDELFINEHILNRITIEDAFKEDTMQKKAKKAFYAVWTNWIFINPKTENLRAIEKKSYPIIKNLSYGAKNRLQSYLAFHLNRDHYDMNFESFTEEEAYSSIQMCEEIFADSYLLVSWWLSKIPTINNENFNLTGEEWFKLSKEKFQRQKIINKLGFCFIDLNKKRFLSVRDNEIFWVPKQEQATRFNVKGGKKMMILDQENDRIKNLVQDYVEKLTGNKSLKQFIQQTTESTEEIFINGES